MTEETAEQKLKRYEYVLEAQADEIDKLRAEIERLQAAGGAHSVLKSIYLNGELPESLRAKAAAASLQFEVPKLLPERQVLDLAPLPSRPLMEICQERMARQERIEAEDRDIEVTDAGVRILPKPNGNGSDEH